MADPLTNGGSSHQNAALLISTYMSSMQATGGGGGIGQTITSPVHMHQSYQQSSYANNGGVYAQDTKGISNLNSHIRGESQEHNPQSRGGSTTPKPGQAKPTVSTGHRSQQSQYAAPATTSQ